MNSLAKYDKAKKYRVILINRIDIVKAENEQTIFEMYKDKPILGVQRING